VAKNLVAALSPHPPLLIPGVGGANLKVVEKTQMAMRQLGDLIAEQEPDTVIVISPHGIAYRNAIPSLCLTSVAGDFGSFGAPDVRMEKTVDQDLLRRIAAAAGDAGITVRLITEDDVPGAGQSSRILDYASMVPLYYLDRSGYTDYELAPLGIGMLPYRDLYRLGMKIRDVIRNSETRVLVLASGDLSHRLTTDAPAGYDPAGKEFDHQLVDLLSNMRVQDILGMDKRLIERAGECGYRPLLILLGTLDGMEVSCQVHSYEGPFGVGYAVMSFHNEPVQVDEYVSLAREAAETYVTTGEIIQPPSGLPEAMCEPGACFVSIKKAGMLRGCIGTILPTRAALAEEIISNAIQAATADPRFTPVRRHELAGLSYSVDILTDPEPVSDISDLDPRRYGVIVSQAGKRGVLLPDLEGVDTVQQQLDIARRKAGIAPGARDVQIERFTVTRHREA